VLTVEKRALVIGSAGGILSACVDKMVNEGHEVFLVDISENALDRQIDDLPSGSVAGSAVLDVTKYETSGIELAKIASDFQPGILLNGVGGDTRVIRYDNLTLDNFHQSYEENVIGTFNAVRNVAPVMEKIGYGRIVNFASAGGRTYSHFNNAAYVASKAAVIGMSKQMAYELSTTGVVVNVVAHGPVSTDRVANAWEKRSEEDKERVISKIPMRRMASINEAIGSVLYLASPSAGYTTGSIIDVNGGIYI
jgi:short-chain dehydrogenase/reductase SDR